MMPLNAMSSKRKKDTGKKALKPEKRIVSSVKILILCVLLWEDFLNKELNKSKPLHLILFYAIIFNQS